MSATAAKQANRNRRAVLASVGIVLTMGGLAYASVPLYRMFCQATGFAGTTRNAVRASDVVLDRTVTVRFDTNISSDLPWTVEPVERTVDVRLGETRVIAYRATNRSNVAVTGTASFNVAPEVAGQYFNKLACFCFQEQTLQPGETIDMPVSFFVDPAAIDVASQIAQITLSYTFYRVEKPAVVADPATKKKAGVAQKDAGTGKRS